MLAPPLRNALAHMAFMAMFEHAQNTYMYMYTVQGCMYMCVFPLYMYKMKRCDIELKLSLIQIFSEHGIFAVVTVKTAPLKLSIQKFSTKMKGKTGKKIY